MFIAVSQSEEASKAIRVLTSTTTENDATFGVNAVPTFLTEKYLMVSAQSHEELKRWIDLGRKESSEQTAA